jgi:phosphoribosyl-ATP pyrophosphohydrolase
MKFQIYLEKAKELFIIIVILHYKEVSLMDMYQVLYSKCL